MAQAVKEQLQKEKDLEGIDLSNIVTGGRRSRAAAAAPRNYRCHRPGRRSRACREPVVQLRVPECCQSHHAAHGRISRILLIGPLNANPGHH